MPNFIINVKEKGAKKASKNIGGLSKKIGALSKVAMAAAAGGIVALGVALKKSADAAGIQEAAERKLATALGHTSKKLLEQASAFQQQSKHGDEALIEMMALASNMGIAESQISETTKMAIGLSEALGVDMNMAMKAAAGAIMGDTMMLTRYIPELKGTTDATAKLAIVQKAANKGFEQSKALTDTMSGAMNQASMAIGDAAEELGNIIAPMVKAGAVATKEIAIKMGEAFDFMGKIDISQTGKNMLDNLGLLGQAMVDTLKIYWDLLPDLFINAFKMIVPKAKIVLGQLLDGIKALGSIIWEPISIGLEIISAKVKNTFIGMMNLVKEQFNSLADTWIGQQAGLEPLSMTDLVDVEGLSMANTTIGDFFKSMGEDNIQNTSEFTAALNDIWAEYAEQTLALNEEVKEKTGGGIGIITEDDVKDQKEKTKKLGIFKKELTDKELKGYAKASGSAEDAMKSVVKAESMEAVAGLIASIFKTVPFPLNAILAAGAGATASGLIDKGLASFATGADFVTSGPQMLMVGDNPSGMERVSVTPLGGDPNINGPQGGGGSVTVNVSGNVLTQDFVETDLAEAIREAARRGTDFGIS